MPPESNYWQRRLPRRKVLKSMALGGAGLSAAAIIGCGDDDKGAPAASAAPATSTPQAATGSPTPTATPTAKRGGALRRWHTPPAVFNTGLDPHPLSSSETGRLAMIYQTLIRPNPRNFQIEPEIGQKWEQPALNEIVFTIAPGVKWHNKPPANARALTADDVVFSLNRVRTDDPRFVNRTLLASIEKMEATDKATVKITLKQPDVTTLTSLGSFSLAILNPEVVEKAGGNFTSADVAVGTGAFVLQSYSDTSATLVRNPDYWKPNMPHLDGINMAPLDADAMWAALQAGQIDLAFAPGIQSKKIFDEQKDKNYYAEWFTDFTTVLMQPNVSKAPFNDPRVPKALRLLLDHEEAVAGWAEVHHGRGHLSVTLPAALADWDYSQEEYVNKFLEWKRPKDAAVAEALSLLNAAGFTKDNPLKFSLHGYSAPVWTKAIDELIQAQYKRLGQGAVEVTELKLGDVPTTNSLLIKGEFDVVATVLVAPQGYEPDSWFRTFHYSKGGRNFGKHNDPALDQLIDKQRAQFNPAERKATVKEILARLIDQGPYTNWAGKYQLNTALKRVKNYAPEGNTAIWGFQYEGVWLDT